ncbi:MAG TPA: UDP-N-acetylmuramoyl-tripeptide--D-alanyl-D-alanine ligase [Acidothermaceae bacterium]|nr:UDP-N-acetylmuramoyl-tripeptide--D-alanyl-D-alanine ligase [Acidothermaceae bacterium]
MIPLTLADIAALADGVVATGADPATSVAGPAVADSRQVVPGSLFVAVVGARVDAHDFVPQAVADGAAAVLASRPVDAPAVLVDDTVLGLGRLARGYLDRLSADVVGLTGSSGKTSTKDLLAAVLATAAPTVAPHGSFNTEVGVPLTMLRADPSTRYLVLEMSARGVGHIAYLCEIAPPRVGIVLNVGAAHLGEFGSREIVAQAKGELVEALPSAADGGVAVLNADDPLVSAMRPRTRARVVTFGASADADVRAVDVSLDDAARPRFALARRGGRAEPVKVAMRLHGAHQVSNATAVAAAAVEVGLDLSDVAAALSEAQPTSRWRMEVRTRVDGVTVVNDAYNANPESMRAAISALVSMRRGGRCWAVLGEMAELGVQSDAAHREIGAVVASSGVDKLVVIGAVARGIADGAVAHGFPTSDVVCVGDVGAALDALGSASGGDVVLVKASRAAALERVAQALLEQSAEARA